MKYPIFLIVTRFSKSWSNTFILPEPSFVALNESLSIYKSQNFLAASFNQISHNFWFHPSSEDASVTKLMREYNERLAQQEKVKPRLYSGITGSLTRAKISTLPKDEESGTKETNQSQTKSTLISGTKVMFKVAKHSFFFASGTSWKYPVVMKPNFN